MSAFTGMTRLLAGAVILLGSLTMTACGGGGAGTPIVGGPGPDPTKVTADLSLTIDKTTVPNTGAEEATVTVTALDAARNVVGAAPVAVTVDNNAFVTPSGTATAAGTGQITAKVAIGADKSNRTITLTARSGAITKTVSFEVVDSISGSKTSDLVVTLSKPSLTNSGSDAVTVTVTALDTARKALGGVPVSFSVNANAVVSDGGKTITDAATGQISAAVTVGADKSKRTVTVNATSGAVTRSIAFEVVDAVNVIPKAADLTLVLSTTNIINSGSETVGVTVTAVDASRNALSGIPVAFKVDQNAVLIAPANVTNTSGQATATVQIGSDKSNRIITVTVNSDALVRTASFQVTGAKLTVANSTLSLAAGAAGKVDYVLKDTTGSPMVGVPVSVSGAGITAGAGTTDNNGAYTFNYVAPATPGNFDITALSAGVSNVQSVLVLGGSTIVPPATTAVVSAALSVDPNVVRVNSELTNNRTEVRALFLGANNVPVKNVRVRFKIDPNNSVGGTITAGTSLSYSDVNGAATTAYIPGSRSSPTDGLRLRACYDLNDFPDFAATDACPGTSKEISVKLTVVSEALSVTIGTNETIEIGASNLTYIQKFVLLVVDSAGNAKADVQITPSLDLTAYAKGYYGPKFDTAQSAWIQTITAKCLNEDTNRNGSIDGLEDVNGNAALDPRKSDAAISMVGSTKTDSSGTAVLKIEYPKSHASWVSFKITAAAFGVLSPPAIYSGVLPADAKAIKTETPPPAFLVSPYGIVGSCTDPN